MKFKYKTIKEGIGDLDSEFITIKLEISGLTESTNTKALIKEIKKLCLTIEGQTTL